MSDLDRGGHGLRAGGDDHSVFVLAGSPPRFPGGARRPVERPLDGDASALVRPYYAAYEEAAAARRGRLVSADRTPPGTPPRQSGYLQPGRSIT